MKIGVIQMINGDLGPEKLAIPALMLMAKLVLEATAALGPSTKDKFCEARDWNARPSACSSKRRRLGSRATHLCRHGPKELVTQHASRVQYAIELLAAAEKCSRLCAIRSVA